MKNKILLIVGIVFIIIGAAISNFAKFDQAAILGFASTMFGAGIACADIWNKRDKAVKVVLPIVSLVLIGVGCFILGFGGFAETTALTIITSVIGIVAIIAGIIVSAIKPKTV